MIRWGKYIYFRLVDLGLCALPKLCGVGNLVGESEIAHLIYDLCFDPQANLPVLKLTTLLGDC